MNNEDPFSSVRIRKNSQESFPQKPNENDPFKEVRLKKSEEAPWLYETGRHAARIGSRIAETIGGIPGDISSLIQSGVITGLNKLTGHQLSPEGHEEIKKQRLPTSSELKELSQKTTKGFTSPKNETEKFIDEVAETATSLLGPMKFRKSLGVALGSSLAKEGVKLSGLGEVPQESAKLGTMLMLTALNPGGALKYAESQYKIANQLSKGASIQATNMRGNLENLLKDLQKGVSTTSKNAVIRPIEDILNKVNNNKILVHDLTAAKRDLNTLMKDPELLRREKKLLKNVSKEIDTAIKPYEKTNPAFSKSYRPANEIYGAVMQGNKAYDFIKRNLGGKSIIGAALGELALGKAEYILPTIAGAAGIHGTSKAVDFFTRIAKSKQLQKYYSKAIASALKEDLPALKQYEGKIEEEFSKGK